MDGLLTLIGLVVIAGFLISVPALLKRIAKHLYRIQLLLELQNPTESGDSLWQRDQIYRFWRDQAHKYHEDISDENKEISDLVFDRFIAQMSINELSARINFHAIDQKGDTLATDDKLEDALAAKQKEIRELEKKISEINPRLKTKIDDINNTLGFGYDWKYDED